MTFFLAKRLAQSLLVLVVVAFFAFIMVHHLGDPVNNLVGVEASVEERERLRLELGLDDPMLVQFVRYVGSAVTGDFGFSLRLRQPVADLIAERLPATLELVAVSAVFALSVGVALGVYTGLHRGSVLSQLVLVISLVGVSVPTFVIGIGLIYLFAVVLGWLPSNGRGPVTQIGFWSTGLLSVDGWRSIAMPAVTLGIYQLTLILRLVRAEMLEVLRTDFIKFARARGLPDRLVHFRHALANTLMPVVTVAGLQIGSLIAFALVTETVFNWPGIGSLFVQSVNFADVPVMAAYLTLVGVVFVLVNLLVDILYAVIDPRLRTAGRRRRRGGAVG